MENLMFLIAKNKICRRAYKLTHIKSYHKLFISFLNIPVSHIEPRLVFSGKKLKLIVVYSLKNDM
jgi:hypothetical protein